MIDIGDSEWRRSFFLINNKPSYTRIIRLTPAARGCHKKCTQRSLVYSQPDTKRQHWHASTTRPIDGRGAHAPRSNSETEERVRNARVEC
jgi:hypothetical protein